MYRVDKNNLTEIVLVSTVLGGVVGLALVLIGFGVVNNVKLVVTHIPLIVVYGLILPIHFTLEFLTTYWYQPGKVTSRSFVIYGNNGNREFWSVQILCILEYVVRQRSATYLSSIGLLFIVFGLAIRFIGMKTCGESFSHYIEVAPSPGHKLITHGIYSYLRHPSYFGYWFFILGIQMFLQNPLNALLDMSILLVFFSKRIKFEEWFLVNRFYGEEYEGYRRRVWVWIPFVWT